MSVTKADKDPHYICQLCNCDGDSEIMFNHLLGRDHQETFIKTLSKLDVNLVNLQEETEKVKDNGKLELLVTIYSDELIPWPEGMAPWSVEQGTEFIKFDNLIFLKLHWNFGKNEFFYFQHYIFK